jgi:2-iminobutanoate/2-iminopropanoate deaminase
MEKVIIETDKAPAAIGPYSQAVKIDRLVFVSGQIPINPSNGEVIKGDIQAQTRQVLNNLEAVLSAAGSSLDKVVKTTLFITRMVDFPRINEVYAEFFPVQPPARACVEVSALPKGVDVEAEAIAFG